MSAINPEVEVEVLRWKQVDTANGSSHTCQDARLGPEKQKRTVKRIGWGEWESPTLLSLGTHPLTMVGALLFDFSLLQTQKLLSDAHV